MKFTVYSKNGCPYCVKIKDVLTLCNQSFVVYKLNTDFTKEEFYNEFGRSATFPQVVCDEQKLGGCNDTIKFLKEQKIV
jgi:glutaredoxin